MSTFMNLTPHSVKILSLDGLTTVLELPAPPKGQVFPRVSAETRVVSNVDGVPLTSVQFGKVEDLPELQHGIFLIVSALVQAN